MPPLKSLNHKPATNYHPLQSHMDSASKWFEKALGFAKASEAAKKKEEAEAEAASTTPVEKKPEVSAFDQKMPETHNARKCRRLEFRPLSMSLLFRSFIQAGARMMGLCWLHHAV